MGRKKLIIIITIGIVAFAGAVGTLIALNKFGIITKKNTRATARCRTN